jgi:hypothetical protein
MYDTQKTLVDTTYTYLQTKYILKQYIDLLARIACKNNGILFGESVRDCIILDLNTTESLDFCFYSLRDKQEFISDLITKCNITIITDAEINNEHVHIQKCNIPFNGKRIKLNLNVKPKYDSNNYDFVANGLIYDGDNIMHISQDPIILKLAIEQAQNAVLVPNPAFSDQFRKNKLYYIQRITKIQSEAQWYISNKSILLSILQS